MRDEYRQEKYNLLTEEIPEIERKLKLKELNGDMNEEQKNSKKRDYFLCSKDTHNRWRA